ncbi:MAG: helicase C-terminal domain-containing protein [Candidatus Cloacimonadaceae bacterium]|nr:DEAD/DEAH box helicase family protein [Candidatus Cloacimonadota bacterium]MDD5316553.1 helicase C-terminal domain-containing protein [Candidatus Cloacimonadota bacterium]
MKFSDSLNFTALDIETTGLSERKDEIIQIAAVRFRGGKVVEVFDSFVKPTIALPKFIMFLTHIQPEDVKDAPDVAEVLAKLKKFLGSDTLVGHNVSFDLGFINYNYGKIGDFPLENTAWDTVELSRTYLPFGANHKLGTMVKQFGITLENAHRADADAKATGELLMALGDFACENFSMIVNARLHSFAKMAQIQSTGFFEEIVRFQRQSAISTPPSSTKKSPYYNVIDNSLPAAANPQIDAVFSEDGIFAHKFPNFEFRRGQVQMAQAVSDAFNNEDHLVVEAGTGVGKSFAYLVPALEFAHRSKAKVVVSTNTKNLQEQLFYKDLPQLAKILPVPFKAVLIKGRENYICERRWEELINQSSRELSSWDAQALLYLYIWKLQTVTGDISENSSFDRGRFNITWRKICSDRYLCGNRRCQHYRNCHIMILRREIENASVVVANHALLLADMRMENSSLGEYRYLVIDEAHNLMSSASKHLGSSMSYADVIILLNQIAGTSRRHSGSFLGGLEKALIKSPLPDAKKDQCISVAKHLEDVIEEARKPSMDIFNLASTMCTAADSYNKLRIKNKAEAKDLFGLLSKFVLLFKEILKAAKALENVINALESKQVASYDQLMESITAFVMRLSEMEEVLLYFSEPDLDNFALWIENNPRPDRNVPAAILNYAPIEVNTFLKRLLYTQVPSIVFTSATLALRGSFRYFLNQSGLTLLEDKNVIERIVDSPFDYDKQSKLLISSFLPEPKDKFFQPQAMSCLKQIFQTVDVGTMALFTAYRDLDMAYNEVADHMYYSQRPLFAQGKVASRSSILEEFKKAQNAVLLGTSSFWEGVDVQGESLSLLILYKIPFQVPSEPLVEAYIDKLEREDKDSFMHYMLPNALLKIRQGFGRLIRSKNDRGIVLIMDSRVSRKRYGTYFKEILPGKHLELKDELQLMDEITRFFSKI